MSAFLPRGIMSSNRLVKTEHAKRAEGCATLNQTTYSTNGVTFDILCNMYWGHDDTLNVTYAPTFASCIDKCASWNDANADQCVGVDWTYDGSYGPGGLAAGSVCRFLWTMADAGLPPNGDDSARLQRQFVHVPSPVP